MAIGVGTIFVGYWVAFFGWCSLKGPGVGFIDLIVPGRLAGHVIPTSADSSGGSGGAQLTPKAIEILKNAPCSTIRKLDPSTFPSILRADPSFALTLARCGFTAPPAGPKGTAADQSPFPNPPGLSVTNPGG